MVLHLHQYRLVCATGVCFTDGRECTRCHGRNTLPGVVRNCRGGRSEALAYGASLALWQQRLSEQADAFIVPSEFARERLRELGAPLDWERVHVLPPPVQGPRHAVADAQSGSYALVVSRLAPEKGVDVAIEACRMAGVPLVVARRRPRAGMSSGTRRRANGRFALLLRASGRRSSLSGCGSGCGAWRSSRRARPRRSGWRRPRRWRRACRLWRAASGRCRSWSSRDGLVEPGDAARCGGDRAPLAGCRPRAERGRARVRRAVCAGGGGRRAASGILGLDARARLGSATVGTRLRRGGGILGNRSRARTLGPGDPAHGAGHVPALPAAVRHPGRRRDRAVRAGAARGHRGGAARQRRYRWTRDASCCSS